jgi:hypothetical protein
LSLEAKDMSGTQHLALVKVDGSACNSNDKYYVCDPKHKDFKFVVISKHSVDWDEGSKDRYWNECYLSLLLQAEPSKLNWWMDPKYAHVYSELFKAPYLKDHNFTNELTRKEDVSNLLSRYPNIKAKLSIE